MFLVHFSYYFTQVFRQSCHYNMRHAVTETPHESLLGKF